MAAPRGGDAAQDYFLAPDQEWIFGVRNGVDLVRQFEVVDTGKGFVRWAQGLIFSYVRSIDRQCDSTYLGR